MSGEIPWSAKLLEFHDVARDAGVYIVPSTAYAGGAISASRRVVVSSRHLHESSRTDLTEMLRAGERGYACGAGRVHVKRVAALLAVIADLEPEILRRRARRDAQSSSKPRERSDAKKDALVEMAARACGRFDALSLQDDDDRREPTPQEAASTKNLAERAIQKHSEKLLKDSDLNDPQIGQKGFRERYYRKVLKHGPHHREGVVDRESAIRDLSVEY